MDGGSAEIIIALSRLLHVSDPILMAAEGALSFIDSHENHIYKELIIMMMCDSIDDNEPANQSRGHIFIELLLY